MIEKARVKIQGLMGSEEFNFELTNCMKEYKAWSHAHRTCLNPYIWSIHTHVLNFKK